MKGICIRRLVILLCLVIFFAHPLADDVSVASSTSSTPSDPSTRGLTLVLLAADDQVALERVATRIEGLGGRVVHRFPHRAVVAELPVFAHSAIRGWAGVVLVSGDQVPASAVASYPPRARMVVGVWNHLLAAARGGEPRPLRSLRTHAPRYVDALVAPDLPPIRGSIGVAAGSVRPGYYQTSEYMAGTVAVGMLLVESNGQVDPSTESWLPSERETVVQEIVTGLDWWSAREPRANLQFVYEDHTLPTGVEPISRPYTDQRYWIADAMAGLGYTDCNYFACVRAYTNDLRDRQGTDWAFTVFVVDSSADGDNRFGDGYFAYAYLGGPFMVMTSGNNGYGLSHMDAVAAHEMGHLFRALDQYAEARQPCTQRSGYLGVENQNSECGTCASDLPSIMRGGVWPYFDRALDPYAAGQVGWRDSDADDILDPLDVRLPVTITKVAAHDDQVRIDGWTEIVPYPSPLRPAVTINDLVDVRYRFDGGEWRSATPANGAFSGAGGAFFLEEQLSSGRHRVEIAAVDSIGNVSEKHATQTIDVTDPDDGVLNTVFNAIDEVPEPKIVEISGVAYHLLGERIASVRYRIDEGPWREAGPSDGLFDSEFEPFVVTATLPVVGEYLLEAYAIDEAGSVDATVASTTVTVAEAPHRLFLPLVVCEPSRF